MVQTLDNLRRDGTLNIIEYLERMPDKLITRKQELIESLKKQANLPVSNETPIKGGEDIGHVIGSELDAAKKISQLPTSMQAKYNDFPATDKHAGKIQ